MSSSAGLELEAIAKSFGPSRVLDSISLDVRQGEFLSLVGPSGCGKSTLLRIIAGLEFQDQGTVRIGAEPVDHLGPRGRNIAMVFQNYALYPHLSVFDNIALPLTMSRLPLGARLPLLRAFWPKRRAVRAGIAKDVTAVADQLQVRPLLARKPGQLSGGQRQRVALARAMVRRPSLFLMDEPLSNLDAQLRVHMRQELAELHQSLGATFVYVTHDQVEAMTMSDRVAMLDQGRLAQLGTPAELYDRPASLAVAKFIGSPTMNLLPAEGIGDGRVRLAGTLLALDLPAGVQGPLTLGIRPEHLTLLPPVREDLPQARLHRIEHHGADRLLFLDLDGLAGQRLTVRADDAGAREPGDRFCLEFDPARLHLFGPDGVRLETLPAKVAPLRRMAAS